MGISWAQGLLAGAAGVAEYSQQEQQRRQKRLDRTNELKNNMRSMQAKSKYASKMNSYEENQKQIKAFESAGEDKYTQQIALGKALKFSEKFNHERAEAVRLGTTAPLTPPGSMKLPEFQMPSMIQGQARSPLGDWAANYSSQEEAPSSVPQGIPEVAQGTLGPQGPEGIPAQGEAIPQGVAEDDVTLEAVEPVEFEGFSGLSASPIKHEIKSRTGVKSGEKGTFYDYLDPLNPGVIKTTFTPSGMKAAAKLDDVTRVNSDGSEDRLTRFLDPATNEITTGATVRVNPKDPSAPAILVKPEEVEGFISTGEDDTPKGELHYLFPEGTLEALQKSEKFQTNVTSLIPGTSDNKEAMKRFNYSVGSSYLRMKQAAYADEELLSGDQLDSHAMSDFKKLWLASSISETLGPERVVDLVREGIFTKEMFIGMEINESPELQQIQKQLGLLEEITDDQGNKTLVPPKETRDEYYRITDSLTYSM